MIKKKISGQRTVLTYDYLWHNSFYSLETAKNTNKGRFYNLMTSEVFACFSIEAFLNHIGSIKISEWSLIERCLSPKEKLILIASRANKAIDFGKRPYQSLIELFTFRNFIVHGKTEIIQFNGELTKEDIQYYQILKWKNTYLWKKLKNI